MGWAERQNKNNRQRLKRQQEIKDKSLRAIKEHRQQAMKRTIKIAAFILAYIIAWIWIVHIIYS